MTKEKEKAIFPVGQEVKVGFGEAEKTFLILPMPRSRYSKIYNLVGDIVQDLLSENPNLDLKKLEENIPALIGVASDKLGKLYEIALDTDQEWLDDNMLFYQEVELLEALIDQNDIEQIVKNVQRMTARFRKEKSVKLPSSKKSAPNIN